jgi:hypothetical protein
MAGPAPVAAQAGPGPAPAIRLPASSWDRAGNALNELSPNMPSPPSSSSPPCSARSSSRSSRRPPPIQARHAYCKAPAAWTRPLIEDRPEGVSGRVTPRPAAMARKHSPWFAVPPSHCNRLDEMVPVRLGGQAAGRGRPARRPARALASVASLGAGWAPAGRGRW